MSRTARHLVGFSLLVAALHSATIPVNAQSYGDAFSSVGCDTFTSSASPRTPRNKPEPKLNFDSWRKTLAPARLDAFAERDLLPGERAQAKQILDDQFFEVSENWRDDMAPGDAFTHAARMRATDYSGQKIHVYGDKDFSQSRSDNLSVTGFTWSGSGFFSQRIGFRGVVISSSANNTFRNSGSIQGATNGTIGPQSRRPKTVKKPKPPRAASPLRQALHDIWVVESLFQPDGRLPTRQQMLSLNQLYLKASRLETHPIMKVYFEFMASMAVEDLKTAWQAVDKAFKLDPQNAELFKAFKEEFDYIHKYSESELLDDFRELKLYANNSTRRHYVAAKRALEAKQFERAFADFEEIYCTRRDSIDMVNKIVELYRYRDRPIESCIWLSRFLKVAPDWPAFDQAWDERISIEASQYRKYLQCEPFDDSYWSAQNVMPLKVYVEKDVESDEQLNLQFLAALDEWMLVGRGKFDYVLVDKKEGASIVVHKGTQNKLMYEQFIKPNTKLPTIPKIDIRPPKEADTATLLSGKEIVAAEITFVDEGEDRSAADYYEISLHELGHALGLLRHSTCDDDVMYPFRVFSKYQLPDSGFIKNQLSQNDKQRMEQQYIKHPINAKAYDKFVGMNAICKTLSDPLDPNPPEHIDVDMADLGPATRIAECRDLDIFFNSH